MKTMSSGTTRVEISASGKSIWRLKLTILCGATLLGIACASEPASTTGGPLQPVVPQVCRSEPVTGSNFKNRVCHTAEEWATIDSNERRTVDEIGRQSRENSSILEPGSARGQPVGY